MNAADANGSDDNASPAKGVWSSGSTTVYNRRQGFGGANREGPKCENLYFSGILEAICY